MTEIKERYTFDKAKHYHALDGKPLTGITTVLSVIAKPALIGWAAKMTADYASANINSNTLYTEDELAKIFTEAKAAHRKKKEEAGTKGSDIHAQIETIIKEAIDHNGGFIKGNFTEAPDQIRQFIAWAAENDVRFMESEKNIYSESLWLGGIADIVCEIDGKRYVGDIKTSSAIYPEHFIQASAYAKMMIEMGLYPEFHGVIILNCRKDGTFEQQINYDLEGNFQCFQAALTLYRFLNSLK